MNTKRYSEQFKAEAVRQVVEGGISVAELAARINAPAGSIYKWVQTSKRVAKAVGAVQAARVARAEESAEVKRLVGELKRVTAERDFLRRAAAYFVTGNLPAASP